MATKAKKESTADMSSLAARVLTMKRVALGGADAAKYNALLADAKALAGSVLSQDETKGQVVCQD